MMTPVKPKRRDIWLLRFPFTDLSSSKVRPALIITTYGEDSIVLGIFSRVPLSEIRDTWILIDESCSNFVQTGFMRASLVKAEKIAVIHNSILTRKLGTLPKHLMNQVDAALKKALKVEL